MIANGVDPDEIMWHVASHLGLHCLLMFDLSGNKLKWNNAVQNNATQKGCFIDWYIHVRIYCALL